MARARVVLVGGLVALAAARASAQDPAKPPEKPPEPEKPKCPEFVERDLVRRPDGSLLWYYRVRYANTDFLAAELNNFKAGTASVGPIAHTPSKSPQARPTSGETTPKEAAVAVQNVVRIATSDDDLPFVRRLLEMLDAPQPQVLIEARVAELIWDDETRIGVTSSITKPVGDTFFQSLNATFPNTLAPGIGATADFMRNEKFLTFDYMVQAAASGARTDVTSQPSVLASQGETAILRAGDEEPVVQQNLQGSAVITTTTFKPIGVRLEVQPLLISKDAVRVRIAAESSRLTEFRITSTGLNQQIVNPVVSSRGADTVVTVPDGGTIIIGGLEQKAERDVRTGLPLLKDIPGLGYIFGSTTKRTQRNEVFFWITLKSESPETARLIVPPSEKARLAGDDGAPR